MLHYIPGEKLEICASLGLNRMSFTFLLLWTNNSLCDYVWMVWTLMILHDTLSFALSYILLPAYGCFLDMLCGKDLVLLGGRAA